MFDNCKLECKRFTPTILVLLLLMSFDVIATTDQNNHAAVYLAQNDEDPHAHHRMMMDAAESDPHAHHKMMMQNTTSYQKNLHAYTIPDLVLKDMHNADVAVRELFGARQPLVVSFIFTSCDTICPVLTATLSSAQDDLLASETPPLIVSVSIDPEEDTPYKLRKYAADYNASDQWLFLTGPLDSIIRLQRSMNVYRGSKLNQNP